MATKASVLKGMHHMWQQHRSHGQSWSHSWQATSRPKGKMQLWDVWRCTRLTDLWQICSLGHTAAVIPVPVIPWPVLAPPQAGDSSSKECSSPWGYASLKGPGVGLRPDDQHWFPGSIQALGRGWSWCHQCDATPVLRELGYTCPGWGQATTVAEPQEKPFIQFRWKPESSLLATGRQ